MGINVDTTISFTFLLGGLMAGAAGLISALYQTDVWFFSGFTAGLLSFTAAVMGGIGNLKGAVLGGLIIGVIQQISDNRIGTEWTAAIVFALPRPHPRVPAAGPARRADEGGRMSTTTARAPRSFTGGERRVGRFKLQNVIAAVLHRGRDPAAVLLRLRQRLHRRLDDGARVRRHGPRPQRRGRLRRPAGPRLRGVLRDRRVHDGLVRLELVRRRKDIHIGVAEQLQSQPGIHLNWLLILPIAALLAATLGAILGFPTLRLRGDYIAIVTLAFGEIIGRIAINSDEGVFGIGDVQPHQRPLRASRRSTRSTCRSSSASRRWTSDPGTSRRSRSRCS